MCRQSVTSSYLGIFIFEKGICTIVYIHVYCIWVMMYSYNALQDIEHLESIWELGKEWEGSWNEWKVVTFSELQTENMMYQAQAMLKKLTKISREIKASYMH